MANSLPQPFAAQPFASSRMPHDVASAQHRQPLRHIDGRTATIAQDRKLMRPDKQNSHGDANDNSKITLAMAGIAAALIGPMRLFAADTAASPATMSRASTSGRPQLGQP